MCSVSEKLCCFIRRLGEFFKGLDGAIKLLHTVIIVILIVSPKAVVSSIENLHQPRSGNYYIRNVGNGLYLSRLSEYESCYNNGCNAPIGMDSEERLQEESGRFVFTIEKSKEVYYIKLSEKIIGPEDKGDFIGSLNVWRKTHKEPKAGDGINLFEFKGDVTQEWRFIYAEDGYYYIVPNGDENLAVKYEEVKASDGMTFDISICEKAGQSFQKWELIKAHK